MFRPSFVVLIYVTVCLRQKDTNYFSVVSKNCQEFLRFPFDIIKAGITLFFLSLVCCGKENIGFWLMPLQSLRRLWERLKMSYELWSLRTGRVFSASLVRSPADDAGSWTILPMSCYHMWCSGKLLARTCRDCRCHSWFPLSS